MGSISADSPKVQEEMVFNINHKVKVSLTPRGLEVLCEKIRDLKYVPRNATAEDVEAMINLHFRRDGSYVIQMYEFMAIFGSALPTFATSDPRYILFVGNDIVLILD